jgi:DmsE family decaheme c-type cytochrome
MNSSKTAVTPFPRILMLPLLLLGLLLGGAATALADDGQAAKDAEYTGMAPQICLNCHGETSARPAHEMLQTAMARKGDPNSPFGGDNHSCESCHGPSKAHVMAQGKEPPGFLFDGSTTTEQKNESCLSCHEDEARFHWPGATHNLEGVACIDCHSVHAADDPVLALETQPEVCFDCHKEQRAQFLRQSHHPVQASSNAYSHTGLLACTDCHNPHGNDGPAQLKRNTINETCYDCHAEKRGPFLWEHQPAREDCTNCHTPHGSNHPNLLVARTPWLCQQCHVAPFHPSTAYSGTGVPPEGFAQQLVGKDCLNCHNQVHGSNHPSGIRLTR